MSENQEQWIPAPFAVRNLAARAQLSEATAKQVLAGWFFDERVRFQAGEVSLFMPKEYLEEPYFDDGNPEELQRYSELFGYTHKESDLLRRNRTDELIDPASLTEDCLDYGCTVWTVGELALKYSAVNPAARINYYGITVNAGDVERCVALLPSASDREAANEPNQLKTAPKKGRPIANWWPDFARELAIEIHENGLPESQEALIVKIQATLTSQGKEEPSRTHIQPIIRDIFSRCGPAGKSKP